MKQEKGEMAFAAAMSMLALAMTAVKERHGAAAAIETLERIQCARSSLRVHMDVDGACSVFRVSVVTPSLLQDELLVELTLSGDEVDPIREAAAH